MNSLDDIFNDASVVCNEILNETQSDYYGIIVISSDNIYIDDLKKPEWFDSYVFSKNTYEYWKTLENDILRFQIERVLTAYPLIKIVEKPVVFDINSLLKENSFLFEIEADDKLTAWKFGFNVSKMSMSSIVCFYNLLAYSFSYYDATLILISLHNYVETKFMIFKNMPFSYSKLIMKQKRTRNEDRAAIIEDYRNSIHTLSIFFNEEL